MEFGIESLNQYYIHTISISTIIYIKIYKDDVKTMIVISSQISILDDIDANVSSMKSVSGSVLIILLCKLNDLARITTLSSRRLLTEPLAANLYVSYYLIAEHSYGTCGNTPRAFAHDPFRTTVSESQANVRGEMCLLSGKHLQPLEQVITSNADCKQ